MGIEQVPTVLYMYHMYNIQSIQWYSVGALDGHDTGQTVIWNVIRLEVHV